MTQKAEITNRPKSNAGRKSLPGDEKKIAFYAYILPTDIEKHGGRLAMKDKLERVSRIAPEKLNKFLNSIK